MLDSTRESLELQGAAFADSLLSGSLSATGWKITEEVNGVKLLVPNFPQTGSVSILRAVIYVDGSISEICRRLWAPTQRCKWDLMFAQAKILCEVSPVTRVARVACRLPYPFVDDRDFVLVEHFRVDDGETTAVVAFGSTEAIEVDKVDGCVRGWIDSSGFVITAVPGSLQCKVMYTLYVDMKGQLPQTIVERFLHDVMLSFKSVETFLSAANSADGDADEGMLSRVSALVAELNAVHDEVDVFTPGEEVVKISKFNTPDLDDKIKHDDDDMWEKNAAENKKRLDLIKQKQRKLEEQRRLQAQNSVSFCKENISMAVLHLKEDPVVASRVHANEHKHSIMVTGSEIVDILLLSMALDGRQPAMDVGQILLDSEYLQGRTPFADGPEHYILNLQSS